MASSPQYANFTYNLEYAVIHEYLDSDVEENKKSLLRKIKNLTDHYPELRSSFDEITDIDEMNYIYDKMIISIYKQKRAKEISDENIAKILDLNKKHPDLITKEFLESFHTLSSDSLYEQCLFKIFKESFNN